MKKIMLAWAVLLLVFGCSSKVIDCSGNYVLIDTRTAEEYAAGHLKGAELMPFDRIQLMIGAKVADKSTPIMLYCRSGRRSAIAMSTLNKMGYTKVRNLGNLDSAAKITGRELVK